jgi:hypothetical protein
VKLYQKVKQYGEKVYEIIKYNEQH